MRGLCRVCGGSVGFGNGNRKRRIADFGAKCVCNVKYKLHSIVFYNVIV